MLIYLKHQIKIGEDVIVGDPIGIGGNTGRSTGAHLHFEVQNKKNPRNPRLLLKKWLDQTFKRYDRLGIGKTKKSEYFNNFVNFIPIKESLGV